MVPYWQQFGLIKGQHVIYFLSSLYQDFIDMVLFLLSSCWLDCTSFDVFHWSTWLPGFYEVDIENWSLLCWSLLCWSLLCWSLLCWSLLCWSLLCWSLLCWSLLCWSLLCWSLLCWSLLCWSLLCWSLLCWSLLCWSLLCWSLLCWSLLCWSLLCWSLLCWSLLCRWKEFFSHLYECSAIIWRVISIAVITLHLAWPQ